MVHTLSIQNQGGTIPITQYKWGLLLYEICDGFGVHLGLRGSEEYESILALMTCLGSDVMTRKELMEKFRSEYADQYSSHELDEETLVWLEEHGLLQPATIEKI